jgi:hypothetical protein
MLAAVDAADPITQKAKHHMLDSRTQPGIKYRLRTAFDCINGSVHRVT